MNAAVLNRKTKTQTGGLEGAGQDPSPVWRRHRAWKRRQFLQVSRHPYSNSSERTSTLNVFPSQVDGASSTLAMNSRE